MENKDWSGEGLPPVGTVCLVNLAFQDMGECTITYMGDGVYCYRQKSSGMEYTGSIRETIFRPLKSDREKWIEAAALATGNILSADGTALAAIYDAGLAKLPS